MRAPMHARGWLRHLLIAVVLPLTLACGTAATAPAPEPRPTAVEAASSAPLPQAPSPAAPATVRVCLQEVPQNTTALECDVPRPENDIAAVASLPELRRLQLATDATDLTPLGRLAKLELLDVAAPSARPDPLVQLQSLVALRYAGHIVRSVGRQGGVPVLDAGGHVQRPLVDLAWVAKLPSLRALALADLRVADLAPLANVSRLELLDLSWNVSSAKPLDLAPLGGLAGLAVVDVRNVEVRDLRPLSGTKLRQLRVGPIDVASLGPLEALAPTLVDLSIERSKVRDYGALGKLVGLRRLKLSGSDLRDARVLANLSALEALDLGDTRVSDIAAVAKLPAVAQLDLAHTPVRRFEPLAAAPALRRVVVGGSSLEPKDRDRALAPLRARPELTIHVAAENAVLPFDATFESWVKATLR